MATDHGRSTEANAQAIPAGSLTGPTQVVGMGSRIRQLFADMSDNEPFEVPRLADPARCVTFPLEDD